MPLRREQVAEYHRARRARLKAEQGLAPPPVKAGRSKASSPHVIPLGRSLSARERRADVEMERIEARGGRPEWSDAQGRWRDAAAPPAPTAVVVYKPPVSTFASGGTPPRPPVKAVTAEVTADLRARLAMHARAIEELTRRDMEKERRLAALEAEARARSARATNWKAMQQIGLGLIAAFAGEGASG